MAIGRGLNPNQAGISDPAHRFVELDDLDQQTALSSPLPPPSLYFTSSAFQLQDPPIEAESSSIGSLILFDMPSPRRRDFLFYGWRFDHRTTPLPLEYILVSLVVWPVVTFIIIPVLPVQLSVYDQFPVTSTFFKCWYSIRLS